MMIGRELPRAIRPGLRGSPSTRYLRPLAAARGVLSTSSGSDAQTIAKTEQMAHHVSELLKLLGEDPTRSGLLKTPQRVAKSLQFLTSGMEGEPAQVIGDAFFAETSDELVLVRDITVHSLCEHHMLPFHGKVHVAYVPDGRVVGLSKLARLSDLFSRRLQVQERLTQQIADALMAELAPRGVAVVMECAHMCMAMRGVQKAGATTLTSCMLGAFKDDPQLRSELFQQLNLPVAASRSSGIDIANTHVSDGSCACGVCLLGRRNIGKRIGNDGGVRDAGSGLSGVGKLSLQQPSKPHSIMALPCLDNSSSGSSSSSALDHTRPRAFTAAATTEGVWGEEDYDDDDVDITISLSKEDMKFSAGHFTIFDGVSRETLHGHNFTVSAEVAFSPQRASAAAAAAAAAPTNPSVGSEARKKPIGSVPNGLLMDYGILKKKLRDLCKHFDEVMLLPGHNPHLRIEQDYKNVSSNSSSSSSNSSSGFGSVDSSMADDDEDSCGNLSKSDSETVRVVYGEGAGDRPFGSALLQGDEVFELPRRDVQVLPVANVTGEELSRFLLDQFLESCAADLSEGGATEVKLTVSSGPGQGVTVRRKLRSTWQQQRVNHHTSPSSSGGSPLSASSNISHHRSFSSRAGPLQRSTTGSSTGMGKSLRRPVEPRPIFSQRSPFSSSSSTTSSGSSSGANASVPAGAAGTAVVTGASSGIGLAVAEKFASLGWHVHNISRRPMPEIATQYEQHNHLTDLADDNAVRRAAAEVAAVLRERVLLVANGAAAAQIESEAHRSCRDDGVVVDGSLSNHINRSTSGGNTDDDLSADANVLLGKVCVVHCAGVHTKDSIGSLASLASLPSNSSSSRNAIGSRDGSESGVEAMQRTFQVNVVSPALLTSSLLPSMGTGSSVVYVGSTLSEIGVPGHLSYVASKHAVVGLLRATVQDLFGSRIHAACVCPGFTNTPMLEGPLSDPQVRAAIEGMVSFNRLVEPDEIARLISFVAENPALNGAVLHANLGQKQA